MKTSIFPTAFVLALTLGGMSGCGILDKVLGGSEKAAQQAEASLKQGDLPGASVAYDGAAADHPEAVDVATGAAFMALLEGDTAAADAYLAAAEADAGDRLPEIKLRRALVALQNNDLDAVGEHGRASGLPAGKLLAAEVALADGEREDAEALLKAVAGTPGELGTTAQEYLDLIDDPEPLVAGLSEAQALWALGARKVAVRSVVELVKNLPDTRDDQGEQALIWAGRAASVGENEVAQDLLDSMIFPPAGQAWRVVATKGIIACSAGDSVTCLRLFKTLEGNAPADGLADARATAAFLVGPQDPEAAKKLAGPYVSNAAARALVEAGDLDAAKESAPGGVLADYLNAGG